MKVLYKISAIVVVLFAVCGCNRIPTGQIYDVRYYLVYSNDSNHTIDIVCDSQYYQYPYELEVLQEKSDFIGFSFWISGKKSKQRDAKAQKLIVPEMVTVVYDNEYSITFSRGTEMNNLCYMNDYKRNDSSENHVSFQYTFTEEDYEYAKVNGVKLENSIEE